MSEEFGGALPSEVLREIDRLPAGLLERVIEARYYARMKFRYDAADTPDAIRALPQNDPIFRMVREITFALRDEERRKELPHG